uniref:UDP-glucuronosyltransferase n=1 Tax=Anisakis simplex TaxID=6269 RepID=A0A0M3J158_ANISI
LIAIFRILFVYNGNSFGELPEHVKVLKWAPQFDVLSHNKTILFISHGGLKSVKEAICTSTPVVYLPLFAEQTHNTAMAIKLGFARSLNKMTVTGEKMLSVVRDLLDNNTRYQRAVQRVHDLFLDRPMNSHSEAVFWTNRAVKLHGERNPTFKRRGMFLSLNAHFYLIHLLMIAVTILIASKS